MGVRSRIAVLTAGVAAAGMILPGVAHATTAGDVTPNPVSFGAVLIGSSNFENATIQNTGDVDETISEALTGTSDYSTTGTCAGVTVSPTETCSEEIDFDPTALGARAGTMQVTFTSTADSSTVEVDVPLSGTALYPPLRIQSSSVQPAAFYPLVRDGFRDRTTYTFTLNEPASGAIELFNRKGTLTRSWPFTNRTGMSVTWGGRNRFGAKVKPASYRFRVIAHAHGRGATGGARRVVVKTGFRLVVTRGAKHKRGIDWSSRGWGAYELGGNCNWGPFEGTLLSTCLAAHAKVTYTFELPRGARVTAFSHSVSPGITPCRHARWTTTRAGRIRHATFTHGSFHDFSQCSINSLALTWKKVRKVRI
jgi:hypothetical protein